MTSYQQRKKEIRELEKAVSVLEDRLRENGIEFGQLNIDDKPRKHKTMIDLDYVEMQFLFRELQEIIKTKSGNSMLSTKHLFINIAGKIESGLREREKEVQNNFEFFEPKKPYDPNWMKAPPPPKPPLSRTIREGVGVFCDICHSTMSRRGYLGMFGQRKCDNKECKNSKR